MIRKKKRLETKKKCSKRYNWDRAAKVWENYFDSVDISQNRSWDSPPVMQRPLEKISEELDNHKFCEMLYAGVYQDPYYLFNHKMLATLRDLNQGLKQSSAGWTNALESSFSKKLWEGFMRIGK
jgi:hypothetical protein